VDGVHLNEGGHQLLVRELEKHVIPLIQTELTTNPPQGVAI
jgi:lysophospholipase L1-like esterase